ncbi:SH3 and multiple ankyrin repeat domains protein 3 [Leguminivora glycinivorella]|uniref:SH3 and multiple ankyrin repeat domains protein 3 n=1 Tax=Leguminivora glycinivorella TaxID=1035111 RepID=UPI00200E7F8B|nr:SH3 and multiple ankyrin repeat domains protein 3 [Leguminivora glycinivorella]
MEGESPEPSGWLLVRVHVPELNVQKSLQFPRDQLVWDVKQQCLAALPKVATWYRELKESFNYGLFCPPVNGKAGKFLDEERRLGDYPFNGPVGYLELKYKRRVYKMLKLDEKTLKALHSRANLRRFLEHVAHAQIDKLTKACAKGLDPNFHCSETGETPLTIAAGLKSPGKVLIALVNGGALLDYRTKDGSTAMHRAVEKNSLEAVKTLLELGASPNYKDGKGLTPLYLSVTNKTDPLLCETLLHDHATIGAADLQGWLEVHQACRNGLVQHLDHLLFYGADMNGRNASGNTPLHVCAVNAQDSCARQLLFRGCDKEALNFANQTPYQVAVIAGNLELAEVIKKYRAEEVVPFRGPPRYNPRRRSAAWGWLGGGWPGDRSSLASSTRIPELDAMLRPSVPEPCLDRPFSSASSSISDASHPSHEDDASILTDKSADVSDIISDSSGVGTNSDTTCSLQGAATAVCLQPFEPQQPGQLRLNQGDIVEVTGATDDGFLEGCVRATGAAGLFPAHCVQEVRLRQNKNVQALQAGPIHHSRVNGRREMPLSKTYSATAPRIKKTYGNVETRTVVLHRARRGFGFVLRGAKASSPLMELRPSERCPGLQYLDDVDAGGVADRAGLKKGDFLIAINGEDVSAASHEHVVELIRGSGALVSMTVASLHSTNGNELNTCTVPTSKSQNQLSSSGRPYAATLPRKGAGGRSPAPAPPRRDPRTTLSVGRARAKSMVAGLENGGEKEENCEPLSVAGKSSSAESVQHSNSGTPQSGTPVAPRTASIRQRPASGRITAAELEELFQRQADADTIGGNSAMMTRSAFQGGSASPPYSPARTTRVYASVAEMKRRGPGRVPPPAHPPPPPPGAPASSFRPSDSAKLYASPRDLGPVAYRQAAPGTVSPLVHTRTPAAAAGRARVVVPPQRQRQALRLAPRPRARRLPTGRPGHVHLFIPAHPPPPPGAPASSFRPSDSAKLYASPRDLGPVAYRQAAPGTVSPLVHTRTPAAAAGRARVVVPPQRQRQALRLAPRPRARRLPTGRPGHGAPASSFRPSDSAKLYASPRDLGPVAYRQAAPGTVSPLVHTRTPAAAAGRARVVVPPQRQRQALRLAPRPRARRLPTGRPGHGESTCSYPHTRRRRRARPRRRSAPATAPSSTPRPATSGPSPTDRPPRARVRKSASLRSWAGPARAHSAEEAAHYAQPFNAHGVVRQNSTPAPPIPEPDYSMSESDEEAPKPKEPPAETSANSNASGSSSGSSSMQHSFSVDEIQKIRTRLKSSKSCGDELSAERDDGDNSSSGVSSDQEAQAKPPRRDKVSFCSSVQVKSSNDVISTEPVHSSSESLATPPAMQRHNSLTRKRATAALLRGTIGRGKSAAERLGVDPEKAPGRRTRAAVSLAELPPPPEEPAGPPDSAPVLAPPPQFSDRVRVVAAVPKLAHLQ